jgi:AMMECR1 domain-containing protein
MALTEENVEELVQIVGPFRHVQVRTDLVVKKDGVEIGRQHKRKVIAPDMDVSNESDYIRGICELVHTDAVKAAYAAHVAEI